MSDTYAYFIDPKLYPNEIVTETSWYELPTFQSPVGDIHPADRNSSQRNWENSVIASLSGPDQVHELVHPVHQDSPSHKDFGWDSSASTENLDGENLLNQDHKNPLKINSNSNPSMSSLVLKSSSISMSNEVEPRMKHVGKKKLRNKNSKVIANRVQNISHDTVGSQSEFSETRIVTPTNPRLFSQPPSSQPPRASDLFNYETSDTRPIVWKYKSPPTPLSKQSGGEGDLAGCIDSTSAYHNTVNPNNALHFPKSYFSWFKNLPNFRKSRAAAYCLDSFSALRDCLSENPPLNPTIFHNAGKSECCKRPPPAENSCLVKRKVRDFQNFLDELPRETLRDRIHRWWDSDLPTLPFPPHSSELPPLEPNFSEPSAYYVSSYCSDKPWENNEIPKQSVWDLLLFSLLYLIQFMSLMSWNSVGFLPFSSLALIFAWGRGSVRILNSYFECIGRFIELFFQGLDHISGVLHRCFPQLLRILNKQLWFQRSRKFIFLNYNSFIRRFQTIFLSHSMFKTKILYNNKLRHIKSFIHYNDSGPHKDRGNSRRYRVRRLTRGKQHMLQMFHVKSKHLSDSEIKVPLIVRNNVPLVKSNLGGRNLHLLVDSGSCVNLIPHHLLKRFEKEEGYICTKFESNIKLHAHTSDPLSLCNFGAILPFQFVTCDDEIKEVNLPFLVEKTVSEDIILGLPSLSSLNINVGNNSTCTLNLKNSFQKIIPLSPLPVQRKDGECKIPSEIPIINGIYYVSHPNDQTFHEINCLRDHDPRYICRLSNTVESKYDKIPKIDPYPCQANLVKIVNNKLEFLPTERCTDTQSIFSRDIWTIEFVSKLSKSRKHFSKSQWPGDRENLPTAKTPWDGQASLSVDKHSNLHTLNRISDKYISEEKEINDLDSIDLEIFTDLLHVENDQENNDDNYDEEFNYANLGIYDIKNMDELNVPTSGMAYLHFTSNDFNCLFSSQGESCQCINLKRSNKLKCKNRNSNCSNILVHTCSKGLKHFYFSIPNFSDIGLNPKLVLLVQLLEKFKVSILCMSAPCHASNPVLEYFYERLKFGFQNVVLNHPKIYKLYATMTVSPPSVQTDNLKPTIHSLHVTKNINMRGSDSLIPDEILNEAEAIPFLNVSTFEDDFSTFLNKSGKDEKEYLTALLTEYRQVASESPIDIGKVSDDHFVMDIKLKDETAPLPLEMPYNTTLFKKVAASKIVENWIESGIVVKSNIRTHASRLVIASKHLNDTDFKKIVTRLKNEANLDYTGLDKSQVSRINPSVLTPYEVSKCYRLCLDAKALNLMTRDETVFSPNPDVTISELMSHTSCHPSLLDSSSILNNMPSSLKKFMIDDADKDKIFYSCLDIRGAHNSVTLSAKSSDYLNVVLPSWDTVKFVNAPFGLKNIGSHWNFILNSILKDLIEKGVVTLYSDDILVITRGKVAHRMALAEIFRIFRKYNIKLSLNKCQTFVDSFHFLGFNFTREGVNLTDERVSGILNIQPPRNIKEVQRLLGCLVYISRFIPDIQLILLPISDLLKSTTSFFWGSEQQAALDKIKLIVKDNYKLSFIDATKPLSLYCDSSKVGGGACLFQRDEEQNVKPICFFSRKYNKTQTNHLSALELEIINVLDSLHRLKAFVNCTTHPITLVSDAKALIFLLKSNKEGPNPKLLRLASRLAQYDLNFEIHYEKPLNNSMFLIADFLSRSRGGEDTDLKPPPMKSFRTVEKHQINHNLAPGSILSYSELISAVENNDSWFKGYFPTPYQPYPPTSYSQNSDSSDETNLNDELPSPPPFKDSDSTPNRSPPPFCLPSTDRDPPLIPTFNDSHLLNSTLCSDSFNIRRLEAVHAHPNLPKPEIIHKINFMTNKFSLAEIVKYQNSDDSLKPIIDELTQNKDLERTSNGFFIKNFILHKVKDNSVEIRPSNSLIVIPSTMLPELIGYFHVAFGHIGREKLLQIMKDLYFSPKMAQKIGLLTSGCHLCQINKSNNLRHPPLIQSKLALFPNSQYALDFCHVPTYKGYKLILICIDSFSGFLFTRPCRAENSTEVCNLLRDIFRIFGPPYSLKSDNGSSLLRSKTVKSFLALWGVEKVSLSLPFSPTHNSKAERSIKSIRALIRALCPNKPTQWFNLLDQITHIYNITPRSFKDGDKTILISPFELFTRRRPKPSFPHPGLISDPLAIEFFEKSKKDIVEVEKFVSKFLENQNKLNIARMNKYARKSKIQIGDFVLLRDLSPPQPGKLAKKHLPAYKPILYVVRFIKDHLVVLENCLSGDVIFQSVKFVKVYKNREDIFGEISEELREIMGSKFTPLSFSSREELKNFLNSKHFQNELESLSPPGSEISMIKSNSTSKSEKFSPKQQFSSKNSESSSFSSISPGRSMHAATLQKEAFNNSIYSDLTAPQVFIPPNIQDEFGPNNRPEMPKQTEKTNPWSIITRAAAKLRLKK